MWRAGCVFRAPNPRALAALVQASFLAHFFQTAFRTSDCESIAEEPLTVAPAHVTRRLLVSLSPVIPIQLWLGEEVSIQTNKIR